jgi:hypothetical protein
MVDEVRSRVDRAENADAGNLAKQFQRQPGAILEGDEIRAVDQTEGKMSDQDKQCWPAAKIQRQLRADEALIEIVRAQRVFLASCKQPDNLVRSEAIRRRRQKRSDNP